MTEGTGPVLEHLWQVHARHRDLTDGEVATYIPELAGADPASFGICLVTVDGTVYEAGDTREPFTIQSISKPFTYALVLDELGADVVDERIGVEPTGEPFNAITLDATTGAPLNAMVNAGAIAATGLVSGRHGTAALGHLLDAYAAFAGRRLDVDDDVYRSEAETGHRNRAIAHLLRASGALDGEADDAVDLYFRQCAVRVDCRDLGVMAATLANGGTNPLDGARAASATAVRHVLAVMASCGMYDGAGRWLVSVGLPAKSGVAGGIIAVLPGELGIAVWSPPLDANGNSVRGVAVCRDLADDLGLHLVTAGAGRASPLRSVFTLAQVGSRRRRSETATAELVRAGGATLVLELQGDLGFTDVERVVRRVVDAGEPPRFVVLDLRRVGSVHPSFARLVGGVVTALRERDGALVLSGVVDDDPIVGAVRDAVRTTGGPGIDDGCVEVRPDLDLAMEWCEERVLAAATTPDPEPAGTDVRHHPALSTLSDAAAGRLVERLEVRRFDAGELLVRRGATTIELVLVLDGHASVLVDDVDGSGEGGRRRLAALAGGSLIGELALAAGTPAMADVVADVPTTCAVLPAAELVRLRAEDPEVWTGFLEGVLRAVAEHVARVRSELT